MVRIDWEAVKKYVEGEADDREYEYVGEAYERLLHLKRGGWEGVVVITGKSKPWWKREWHDLRKRARHSKSARKKLRQAIRRAKREMWMDWVSKGKEVWDIVRVCKNPFAMRERCGTLKDKDGIRYETAEEKRRAFTAHNLITEPAAKRAAVGQQHRRKPSMDTLTKIYHALGKRETRAHQDQMG